MNALLHADFSSTPDYELLLIFDEDDELQEIIRDIVKSLNFWNISSIFIWEYDYELDDAW